VSRYIMIRRLRAPAFLLLIGVLELLRETHILPSFWHLFWPLALILAGVIMLAERAALNAEGGFPATPFPGAPYEGPNDPSAGTGIAPYPGQPIATVPAHRYDKDGTDFDGGQS
jgi:hypothetical protein